MEESRLQQKLFIKRERVRRELIHTRPGETICLNHEQTDLLLKWIKELETGSTINDEEQDKPQYMRDGWHDKVTAFMSENPDAREYVSEMAKVITEDENIAKSQDCLNLAYTKVLKSAFKSPAELMEDQKFLDEFVYKNKDVRNKIVSDYLKNLNPQAPEVLGNGGEMFVAPPKRPSTLQEAGAMAEKLLK